MSMYFAPTDEEVESQFGPKLRSWPASPPPELSYTFERTAKMENAFLSTVLQLSLFAAAIALGATIGSIFHRGAVGVFSAIAFGFVAIFVIGKIKAIAFSRAPLGVFERGMRLGGSLIRFDELDEIRFGGPASFSEKHLPNVSKAMDFMVELRLGSRYQAVQEGKEKQKCIQEAALAFRLHNGKLRTWNGFALLFKPEDLEEFFSLLKQLVPEKFGKSS